MVVRATRPAAANRPGVDPSIELQTVPHGSKVVRATRPAVDPSIELQPGPQLQTGPALIELHPNPESVFGAWLCVQPGPQLQTVPE